MFSWGSWKKSRPMAEGSRRRGSKERADKIRLLPIRAGFARIGGGSQVIGRLSKEVRNSIMSSSVMRALLVAISYDIREWWSEKMSTCPKSIHDAFRFMGCVSCAWYKVMASRTMTCLMWKWPRSVHVMVCPVKIQIPPEQPSSQGHCLAIISAPHAPIVAHLPSDTMLAS